MPKLPDKYALGTSPLPRPSTYAPGRTGFETAPAQAQRQLSAAVKEFGQTFDRVQDQQDKTRAEEAYNTLLDKKMDLTLGDDGFTKKKSGDAAKGNLIEDYDERFNTASNEIGDKLTTPRQKAYYRTRANLAGMQYKQDMLRHVTRETDVYQKETFGATIKTETRNAAMRWDDKNAVKASQARINGAINDEADRLGWPAKKTKQIKFEAGSEVHIGIIQAAVNNQDPGTAREWFTKNKKNIDPDKYDDIERLIGGADLTQQIQDVYDDAQIRQLSKYEAMTEIEKKYSGEVRKKLKAGVSANYDALQTAANEQGWDVFQEQGIQAVMNNVTLWDDISGQTKTQMKAKDKAAREGGVKSGGGDYYYLRQLMQADPVQFMDLSKTDLNKYVLAPGDKKELMKQQTDQIELDAAATRDQIIKQTVAALGLDPKTATAVGRAGKKVRAVYKRIDDEIRLESESKGGRKLSKIEIKVIADRLQIEVTRERWYWNLERPAGIAEVEGVPQDMVDELAAAIERKGQPVTDENIKALYDLIQQDQIPPMIRRP